ncbi:MAG: PDZ domain-containing protein [Clostridiales bacterium]|nr:PDZ domain-containing protein [Clostridiales bacterium]
MNKKISLGLAISIAVACITITFAVTMSVAQHTYNKLVSNLSGRTDTNKIISELVDTVAVEYYGSISPESVNAKTAAGYVEGLGDEFSFYLTARDYSDYNTRMSGKTSGIGISAELDRENGYMHVMDVYKGSAADSSGLQKDDYIIAINDEDVTELTYERLSGVLSGQKLTTVKLTYLHESTKKTANVMIGYSSQSIYGEPIGSVGYIRISAFYKNTATQLKNTINELAEEGATSLVLDVRGTKDGTIECACDVLDVIVPVASIENGALATAVFSEAKGSVKEVIATSDTESVTLPMVVLVDGETSGGAELFACDLRDFEMAELVGEKTKGNDTYQKVFELDDGSAVVLTVAKIKPYRTETYAGGLVPDHEVKLSRARSEIASAEEDEQLQAAIALLNNKVNS